MARGDGELNARIVGTGSYVPSFVLTNDGLSKLVDTSDEWITTRTGIKERRICREETTGDMALKAAQSALSDSGITADSLDMIVAGTITPDYHTPSLSCLLQGQLGAANAFAFDINAACSGFVYGLDVISAYMAAGRVRRVLLVCSERLSSITDYEDRSTCVLFGDAAGAVVLEASEEGGVLSTYVGADGAGAMHLYAPAPPPENPFAGERPQAGAPCIRMEGREVFKFAVNAMPRALDRVLEQAGFTAGELRHIIPHQANIRIIDAVIKRYGLSPDVVYTNLDRYGNTSSASIPLCLDELNRAGRLSPGDLVAMVGFGAGLTYGAALVRW